MSGCHNPRRSDGGIALFLANAPHGAWLYTSRGHGALGGYQRTRGGWLDVEGGEVVVSTLALAQRLIDAGGAFNVRLGVGE